MINADEITERYKPFGPGNNIKPQPEEIREVYLKLWDEATGSSEYSKARWISFEIMIELYTGVVISPNKTESVIIPTDMILYCPKCGCLHVDKPEPENDWENPPHRKHRCLNCKNEWKPAAIYTNGVEALDGVIASQWIETYVSLWTRVKNFFQKKG